MNTTDKLPALLPTHVALIMDGNGRWARQRGLPRLEGHRRGAESVRAVLEAAQERGVRHITLYAFSVENWRRPADEVSGLWRLLETFVDQHLGDLIKRKTRLHVVGRQEGLPESVRRKLEKAMAKTAGFEDCHCHVALNYGSRTEVVDAVRRYAEDVRAGRADPETLQWDEFANYLYTAGTPDPDLLIRTSGESRISNFLLLQLAYAELYFTPTLWPDFGKEAFFEALDAYAQRERRFGRTGEQLAPATPAQP